MALDEVLDEDEQYRSTRHALRVFGSIFLSILFPFIGIPLLVAEYYNNRQEKKEEPKRATLNLSSDRKYFDNVYDWLRNRNSSGKNYFDSYDFNGQNRKIKLAIS